MIAAAASKTGVLGFVGGMDIPLIHRFETGFEEGARAVDPHVRVIPNYVGVTQDAWNDPGKGKELAVAQIGKGADVLFAAAGNSGLGAFDAAEQHGIYVIGVDSDQNWIKPGRVLTSMVKRVDNAVYQIVKDRVEGRFRGGIHVYGLANDGVGYAMDRYNRGLIPPAVLARVEAAKRGIIAGRIQVTDAMAR
jgi:basic membrane protein A